MDELEKQLPREEFNDWFSVLRVAQEDDTTLRLLAPNEHFVHTLEQSYRPLMEKVVGKLCPGLAFSFISVTKRLEEEEPEPLKSVGVGLRPGLTFENFAVGTGNEEAVGRARDVANSPQHADHSVLLLYGPPGVGKTALATAIGYDILRNPENLGVQVRFMTGYEFSAEIQRQRSNLGAFRVGVRTPDVLILDEVDFVGRKERHTTCQEFRALLMHAIGREGPNQQLILTMEKHPEETRWVDNGLTASRLSGELCIPMRNPDAETRAKIVQIHARLMGIELPEDVAWFLAQCTSSPRHLVGHVRRLSLSVRDRETELSIEFVQRFLGDQLLIDLPPLTPEAVIYDIATHFSLEPEDILGKGTEHKVISARATAMYLASKYCHPRLTQRSLAKAFHKSVSSFQRGVSFAKAENAKRQWFWIHLKHAEKMYRSKRPATLLEEKGLNKRKAVSQYQ